MGIGPGERGARARGERYHVELGQWERGLGPGERGRSGARVSFDKGDESAQGHIQ